MNASQKSHVNDILSGERNVVVTLFLDSSEVEWKLCSLEEAKSLVHRKMAPRWRWGVDPNQFAWGKDGEAYSDEYGAVQELQSRW